MSHYNVLSHVDRETVVGHVTLRHDGYHWYVVGTQTRGVADSPGEAARLCAIAANVP